MFLFYSCHEMQYFIALTVFFLTYFQNKLLFSTMNWKRYNISQSFINYLIFLDFQKRVNYPNNPVFTSDMNGIVIWVHTFCHIIQYTIFFNPTCDISILSSRKRKKKKKNTSFLFSKNKITCFSLSYLISCHFSKRREYKEIYVPRSFLVWLKNLFFFAEKLSILI